MIDGSSNGDDAAASLLERRWFASTAAVHAMQMECELLREMSESAGNSWRQARIQLVRLEAIRDALGEELAERDGQRESAHGVPLEANAQPSVYIGQQPQRPDHQKLQILEKRGPLAFDGVPDELADPCQDEQCPANQPQRREATAM
jgi:hypothetical protein